MVNYDEKLNLSLLLDFYGDILSGRQKEIANLSLNEDLSLREISVITGITPQGVRDSLNKSYAILKEMEEKLGLQSQFIQMKENIRLMVARLEKIRTDENSKEIDSVIEMAEKML